MVKILAIGDPHGYYDYNKSIFKNVDLILCPGDLGKANIARKMSFEGFKRQKKGLSEKEYSLEQEKRARMEIYNSTIKLIEYLTRFAPVYSILGNVWPKDNYVRRDEKKFGIKIPHLVSDIKKIKDFYVVKNSIRNIKDLRIGFLEYFVDTNWIKDFKPDNYDKRMRKAKKETEKAKRILNRFRNVDILVCHQPPYGVLDKVTNSNAPESYRGKHAGSKVSLNYIKKYQPKLVLCGHIHEAKGEAKIGRTRIINLGCCGDYKIIDFD